MKFKQFLFWNALVTVTAEVKGAQRIVEMSFLCGSISNGWIYWEAKNCRCWFIPQTAAKCRSNSAGQADPLRHFVSIIGLMNGWAWRGWRMCGTVLLVEGSLLSFTYWPTAPVSTLLYNWNPSCSEYCSECCNLVTISVNDLAPEWCICRM